VSFLISWHSSVLWHLALCTRHHSPPSSLSESWRGRLSLHRSKLPLATVVMATAVGVPANGLLLLLDFFFLLLFLPLL
jgi:hypothetical protein